MKKLLGCLIGLAALTGCASKPKLYPNKKYEKVGEEAAQRDVDACMAKAEKYLEGEEGKRVAKGAGKGALVGGSIGAIGGLFGGGVARGALVGGAVGGTAGGVGTAISPDQLKRNFTNRCLHEKGYEVIGWN